MNRMLDAETEIFRRAHDARIGGDEGRWKTWKVFTAVAVIHVLAAMIYQGVVWTDDVYREVFVSRLGAVPYDETVAMARRLSSYGYLVLPLFLWVRVAAFSLVLQFGFLLLWEVVPFQRLFRVLTVASLTGAAMLCTRAFLFSVAPPYEMTSSALVVPALSLAEVVGIESYAPAARVVLQNANVFELTWMALVWRGICRVSIVNRSDVAFVILAGWCAVVALQVVMVLFFGGGLL